MFLLLHATLYSFCQFFYCEMMKRIWRLLLWQCCCQNVLTRSKASFFTLTNLKKKRSQNWTGTRLALSEKRHHDVWRRDRVRPLNSASLWEHQTCHCLSLLLMHTHAPKRNTHIRAEAADLALWRSPIQSSCSPDVSLNVSPDWPTSLLERVSHSIERNHWLGGEKGRESGRKDTSFLILLLAVLPPPQTHRRDSVYPIVFFQWSDEGVHALHLSGNTPTDREFHFMSLSQCARWKKYVFFLPLFCWSIGRCSTKCVRVCVCVRVCACVRRGGHKGVFVVEEEERQCFAD